MITLSTVHIIMYVDLHLGDKSIKCIISHCQRFPKSNGCHALLAFMQDALFMKLGPSLY